MWQVAEWWKVPRPKVIPQPLGRHGADTQRSFGQNGELQFTFILYNLTLLILQELEE
jgi:hypothetical protein